jgi:hypothetical protein
MLNPFAASNRDHPVLHGGGVGADVIKAVEHISGNYGDHYRCSTQQLYNNMLDRLLEAPASPVTS